MLKLKHAVFLPLLLPAFALAAEAPAAGGQNASAPGSSPSQPSPAAPLAVSEPKCDMVARFSATYWYTATQCAQLHKELAPQESKVKNLIAGAYPGLHRAITLPPYSAAARQMLNDMPYRPDANPMLAAEACKANFGFMMRSLDDAATRQTILQCWEQPRTLAKGNPPSPLDDKVCVGAGQYMASAWYRAGMCTARHPALAARETTVKGQLAAAYPDFEKAISTPPLLDAGKYMATYSLSRFGNDPSLSEEGCAANLEFLAAPLNDAEWKDAVAQCWGKPRTVAQARLPAAR